MNIGGDVVTFSFAKTSLYSLKEEPVIVNLLSKILIKNL